MGRLHSIYDDVGNGIKEKVFVLRGDEAYARSTNTIVTVDSTFDESNVEYFTTDVSVEVLRSLGTAPVYLFRDDEQKIGEWNVSRLQHEFTLEDAQFEYGNDIKLYAKFMGNHECLYSKSKPIIIHRDIPTTHKTNVIITTDSQISHSATCSISVALKIGSSSSASVLHDRDIRILVDGAYVKTITTGSNTNTASTTIDNLTDGIHTITAEVDRSTNINDGTASVTIMKGYKLSITDYPTKFIEGEDNTISVSLTNYNDVPIPNATISFNNQSYTTGTDGVATCTFTHIEDGTYHATYQGSVSNDINIKMTYISEVTITHKYGIPFIGTRNYNVPLLITVRGDEVSNMPVSIDGDNIEPVTLTTDNNGLITYDYYCTGYGDSEITASISDSSDTVTIEDCEIYTNVANYDNFNNFIVNGSFVKLNSWYQILKPANGYSGYIRFKLPYINIHSTSSDESLSYLPSSDYSLEFKVGEESKASSCTIQIQGSSEITLWNQNQCWGRGAIVRLVVTGNQLEYIVDDIVISTTTITGMNPDYPIWQLNFNSSDKNNMKIFSFSELKFKKEL